MDNFKDTAYRMYEDTLVLHENKKWFNACYLAGYVLECYSKLIIDNAMTLGINTQKKSVRGYSHNTILMNSEIKNINLLCGSLSQYCIDLNIDCNTIINNWNPLDRYNENNVTWNQEAIADKFKEEIDILIEQIMKMELDGVI